MGSLFSAHSTVREEEGEADGGEGVFEREGFG